MRIPDIDSAPGTGILEFACGIARDSGKIARKHYRPGVVFDSKADNSPVTLADIEINKLVIQRCQSVYPEIGVLGEEESTASTSEWLWVCDPIDGTIPYMLGMQASTFCLALVKDGQPVLGVVYDFFNDRLFSALRDRGAQLNGKPIPKPAAQPLKLVELEIFAGAHNVGDLQARFIQKGWQAPNFASSAFCGMAVATGRIIGAVYTGTKAWDVAATKVIVEECGGKVTDLDGNEQRYDGLIKGGIIAHPDYAAEIIQLTSEARQ